MIRVAVSGAAGRMGRLVGEAIVAAPDLEMVAGYDPHGVGEQVAGITVSADPQVAAAADVIVEFTNPSVVLGNLARWRRLGLQAVVGTSGFDDARLAVLRRKWGSGPPNCLVVPNFSIGAVLMMRFAREAAAHLPRAEIVELHNEAKKDAPSGTARATAELVAAAGGCEPPIHSVRLPGLVAHQEVIFGAVGQLLTIRHDTTARESFAPGVLLALEKLSGLPPGLTTGLEQLLDV
jgi:4-hydroxy-tetrahydrodipicolinate reductase